ncbi:MAG: ABC-2 family transporter protein [Deltaproteobacteria bacterium]|nr:ABC-2 family transporter protein [Deltaproteobacteria bacterium]
MGYLRLLIQQLRMSILLALQYRLDFVVGALLSLIWIAAALVPLVVLFSQRSAVAGWRWHEALIVVGFFTALKGVLDGAIRPALQDVVERIRLGTLDYVLIKPADAQFLVSTTRFELFRVVDVVAGIALVVIALAYGGHWPSAAAIALCLLLLFAAALILYAIWIMVLCLAFIAVKVDNLSFLFASIYDAARWPAGIYRGVVSFVFTFVIPLAVMTTYPALALLERLSAQRTLSALATALVFALLARVAWLASIRRYTSAGG